MELVNKDFVGDFLGFTFDTAHSSTLGLVRVSAGNRYSKNLFPAFTNKTVQPEGKDGFYYFGAYYTNNQLTIDTAFDNLTEKQFQDLSKAFNCKQFKELWFDETPYKAFWAKLAEAPQVKYLCFSDNDDQRVYKGELTLKFETLEPYAHNRVSNQNEGVLIIKQSGEDPEYGIFTVDYLMAENSSGMKYFLEEGTLSNSFNFSNWNNNGDINIINSPNPTMVQNGVKETDYLLKYGISQVYTENNSERTYHDMQYKFKITYGNNESQEFIIEIKDKLFDSQHTSYDLYIDSRKQICYVIKNGRKYILNMERVEGDIFKIPQGEYSISVYQKKSTDINWPVSGDDGFSYSNDISGNGNRIKPYYYFY